MSKRTRAPILGATLAAMNLAGMTAVAHAQATNEAKDARQPPTERQVGETWRHGQAATPEQTAADAALQRQLARERHSIPSATPAQVPAPVPDEPSGTPGWLLASLGVMTVGARWWAGRAGRQASRPQGSAWVSGLTRSHGHAARWGCRAHRQPYRPPKPSVSPASSTHEAIKQQLRAFGPRGLLGMWRPGHSEVDAVERPAIPAGKDLIPQRIRDLRTALPSTRRNIDAGSHSGEVNTVGAQMNDIEEEPPSREVLVIA